VYTKTGATKPDTWPTFVNKLFEKTTSKEKFEIIFEKYLFPPNNFEKTKQASIFN
jgi:hypothetical protein